MGIYTVHILILTVVCLALSDLGHASPLPTESPEKPKTTVYTTKLSNTAEDIQMERRVDLPPSSGGKDNETLASHTKHEDVSNNPLQKSTKPQNKDQTTSETSSDSGTEHVPTTFPTNMKPDNFVNWLDSIHPIKTQDPVQTDSNTEEIVKEDITTAQSKDDYSITVPTGTTPSVAILVHATSGIVNPTPRQREQIVKTFRTSPVPESEITRPDDENTGTSDRDPVIEQWIDLVHSVKKTKDGKNGADSALKTLERTPDLLPPDKFMKWLNGIHSKSYMEKTANHVEISHHSIEGLHNTVTWTTIAIVGAVGSTLLIVLLVISIVLWRQKNSYKDVAEVPGETVLNSNKPKVGCTRSLPHDGYYDVFMGIPSNTDIWKELQCLPKTASSVMPESSNI